RLRQSLKPSGGRYIDKAVQSNRSSVTNLTDCMANPLSMHDFCEALMSFMMTRYHGTRLVPGDEMESSVGKLVRDKYATWEWIYGWSPDYTFENQVRLAFLDFKITLSVNKGIIRHCRLESEQLNRDISGKLITGLTDIPHEASAIRHALLNNGINDHLGSGTLDELIWNFF
ncbi:MAG: hypothetical protein JXQ80_07360, partial [Bacteroidales bacterium]|nr:hypothetical protein [Bacteroidales bacterium]